MPPSSSTASVTRQAGSPPGNQSCLGAQADIAHQMIGQLRSGSYALEDGEPPRFDKVALGGHSTGALIANLEAFSFSDADALVAMSFTPQVTQAGVRAVLCQPRRLRGRGRAAGRGRAWRVRVLRPDRRRVSGGSLLQRRPGRQGGRDQAPAPGSLRRWRVRDRCACAGSEVTVTHKGAGPGGVRQRGCDDPGFRLPAI